MGLKSKEALILFIRRDDSEPKPYMVGMRRTETDFNSRNDLRITQIQKPISNVGEFYTLSEAAAAASKFLEQLTGKVAASGS